MEQLTSKIEALKPTDDSHSKPFSQKQIATNLIEFLNFPPERRGDAILSQVRGNLAFWVPTLPKEICQPLFDTLKHLTWETKADISLVAKYVSDFLAIHTTPQMLAELDKRTQDLYREKGWSPINELLFYVKRGNSIQLHIANAHSKNLTERLRLTIDGLRSLARLVIQSQANGENIERIYGNSWIVAAHPAALERLGFQVISLRETKDRGVVEISVNDLLKRYGSHAEA